MNYLNQEAVKTDNKLLFENKSKIVLAHCSSGQKHALQEVLKEPGLQSKLSDTKYAKEVKALERFYQMLSMDADRAFYGFKDVERAAELGAVDVLMVSDGLFRSSDVAERKKYVALVEKVREMGAEVHVFSALHVSGEQLGNLTGVAAILHFPVPEIAEEEQAEEEDA